MYYPNFILQWFLFYCFFMLLKFVCFSIPVKIIGYHFKENKKVVKKKLYVNLSVFQKIVYFGKMKSFA